jgi:hypothetical protein
MATLKMSLKWTPVGPHFHHLFFFSFFYPSVVLSPKHPNKGPKWGQTQDGIPKLGIITFSGVTYGLPTYRLGYEAIGAKARSLGGYGYWLAIWPLVTSVLTMSIAIGYMEISCMAIGYGY